MTVGIARVSFLLHGNQSLKEKRKVVKSLVEKTRHRFNVAIAEVDDLDLYQKTTIGIAVVGNDGRLLNSLIDRILSYMKSLNIADLIGHEMELIPVG